MSTVEFQSQVLIDFQKKQSEGKLTFAFPKPTPAKIKTACQEVLGTRFEKRDERFLHSYFKPINGQDLQLAVSKFDRDKFKPLNSYLQDPQKNPRFEQIQLLAWLIDFPDRPYQTSYERVKESDNKEAALNDLTPRDEEREDQSIDNDQFEVESISVLPNITELVDTQSHEAESDEKKELAKDSPVIDCQKPFWTKKHVYATVIAAFFTAGIMMWLGRMNSLERRTAIVIPVNGQEGCVIWDNDHYQNISCKQKVMSFASFGLDARTVRDLKKITLPDTITPEGLKRVWYVKIDGRLEYYTAGGFHPIHTDLRLRPLTTYIYNKYLFHYHDKTKNQLSLFEIFK